jgi:hypothetical protein
MAAAVDLWADHEEVPGVHDVAATRAQAVTPSDTVDLTNVSRALYVGGAGAVTVILADFATTVAFAAVPAGSILPVRVSRVKATGTAATSIVAIS